ncbi:M14 family zinc carboxypeptidase [Cellulomonas xiejunii]|uniref:M14 family zinc carboxypeptidase n=1 Tax=Cellulomonas xiejunii TaxID=2968083 RepID=UPI001D0E4004|nr:M14 family zinc carboxypeptidase [Cellulomonas xiejunii]MCC2313611.1 hypothetical protein [Cellulomonas xiejunii]
MPPPYPEITSPMTPGEIDDSLADLAASFPEVCTRTVLPGTTVGGRTLSYLRIRNASGPRPGVLVLGGVHAREWAPPDALITFVRNLLVAFTAGTGITLPAMTVTPLGSAPVSYRPWTIPAGVVRDIVTKVELNVLPLVNPDGRAFDLTPPISTPGWRKNRSPQAGGAIGVDLNRNFDVIWKFEDYYDVPLYSARYGGDEPASTIASTDTYRGAAVHSEMETRAVESLLNDLPIHYFLDIHMAGRNILFSWGLEENGTDPAMNFQNAAFNGTRDGLKRGDPALPGGRVDYQEYLPDDAPFRIRSRAEFIANAMRDEILRSANAGTIPAASTRQQRHSEYTVGQSAFLYLPLGGPNSGCTDDYACSRQFVLPNRKPVFAYTLEAGQAEEQMFHCAYTDPPGHFRKINREIHAALTSLLTVAARSPLPAPGGGGRRCLIATATLGDANHPDVLYLRELRDVRMRATPRGDRAADMLNRVYYSFSPAVAAYLTRHARVRRIVRGGVIRPLVGALRRVLGDR